MIDSLFIWFLITVLPSGQPGDAKGFPTKAICEEARSAAEYGMSVAEKRSLDSGVWAERAAIRAQLDSIESVKAKPRPPKTKADSAFVTQWRRHNSGKDLLFSARSCFVRVSMGGWARVWNDGSDYVNDSGMIQYYWCGRRNEWEGPEPMNPQLKYSACVRKE